MGSADVELPELPDLWHWTECDRCGYRKWLAEGPLSVGVSAQIGKSGIEVMVFAHPPDMDGADSIYNEVPWKVLLAVKNRAIAEARDPGEELRARADDLRPEDRFVNGDRVRYLGPPEYRDMQPKSRYVGVTGTVTRFSTAKHGYEHVKLQSVLVTWDENCLRPGVPIEGRETMVESDEIEAMKVH